MLRSSLLFAGEIMAFQRGFPVFFLGSLGSSINRDTGTKHYGLVVEPSEKNKNEVSLDDDSQNKNLERSMFQTSKNYGME